MINNIFNTHNVLVGRHTPHSMLEYSFTQKGQEDLSEAFEEFLEVKSFLKNTSNLKIEKQLTTVIHLNNLWTKHFILMK